LFELKDVAGETAVFHFGPTMPATLLFPR